MLYSSLPSRTTTLTLEPFLAAPSNLPLPQVNSQPIQGLPVCMKCTSSCSSTSMRSATSSSRLHLLPHLSASLTRTLLLLQALWWTYLGSNVFHPEALSFLRRSLNPSARKLIDIFYCNYLDSWILYSNSTNCQSNVHSDCTNPVYANLRLIDSIMRAVHPDATA